MEPKKDKEDKILSALRSSNSGIWVRELSRKTGIDKSTVSRYLERMGDKIEFRYLGKNKVVKIRQ